MMKKLIVIAAVVATAAVVQAGPRPSKFIEPPAVQAMGAWYVAGYGGASFWQNSFFDANGVKETHKLGWNAGVKVGYDFDPASPARLVLELDGMFNGFNRKATAGRAVGENAASSAKFNMQTFALLANALAKFDCGAFQPYIGAGAGFYTTRETNKVFGKDDSKANGFAWQALAGSDYKIDANWALFLEYKWFNCEKVFNSDIHVVKGSGRIGQQLVNIGVRYQF